MEMRWHSGNYNFSLIKSCTCLRFFAEDGEDIDASSPIPLDDGMPIDFAAIEVVQCLIEHHNAIFTDANETTWR